MFYWFVLVSFNTRAKVKHLGGGMRTFFVSTRELGLLLHAL